MGKRTLRPPGHPHGDPREETWSPAEAEGLGFATWEPRARAHGSRTAERCHHVERGVAQRPPPRGLTQQLLKHLPIVQVLLQLLHDDPLLHQHVVDPGDEDLRADRRHGLARRGLEGQAVTRARAEGATPPGQGPGESQRRGKLLSARPPPGLPGVPWESQGPGGAGPPGETGCLLEGDLSACENSAKEDDGIHHNMGGEGSK